MIPEPVVSIKKRSLFEWFSTLSGCSEEIAVEDVGLKDKLPIGVLVFSTTNLQCINFKYFEIVVFKQRVA